MFRWMDAQIVIHSFISLLMNGIVETVKLNYPLFYWGPPPQDLYDLAKLLLLSDRLYCTDIQYYHNLLKVTGQTTKITTKLQ